MSNLSLMSASETASNVAAAVVADPVINESLWETTARFMQEGGTFMYIILGIFLFGLAIAVERFIYLSTTKLNNRRIWKKLQPHLDSGDMTSVQTIIDKSSTGVAKILSYGLVQSQAGRRSDDIEMAMEEGLMEVLPRLEKRTQYLATFANIATLLGLLGTIMGLISAFTAVANVDPAEKANLLSASISVAMNTTAFGLMAAIPLLLSFSYLQSKTTEIVDSLEMATVKFVNQLRKGLRNA